MIFLETSRLVSSERRFAGTGAVSLDAGRIKNTLDTRDSFAHGTEYSARVLRALAEQRLDNPRLSFQVLRLHARC